MYESSLRVRGTELFRVLRMERLRVIPACAGNGSCIASAGDGSFGSSLRVRGTGCLSWYAIEFSCQIQTL